MLVTLKKKNRVYHRHDGHIWTNNLKMPVEKVCSEILIITLRQRSLIDQLKNRNNACKWQWVNVVSKLQTYCKKIITSKVNITYL